MLPLVTVDVTEERSCCVYVSVDETEALLLSTIKRRLLIGDTLQKSLIKSSQVLITTVDVVVGLLLRVWYWENTSGLLNCF